VRLVWTPEAQSDRDAIYTYIEKDDPRAAVDVDELFERRSALLV
jgi:plasmid stabilization system protein ParE